MDTRKLAVDYVRVSTEHQVDNFSVEDQRGLKRLAEAHGFGRVETREELGVSAETITARPVMKGILEDIAAGKVGAIIVSSFTRLTRDIDDIDGKIIKKTCRDHDCVIITPEKLYDFSNEADDDLADLQFFFSKIQKRMNLKPMIRAEYTKAKNGGFVGLPLSVGYEYKWKLEETRKGTRSVADLIIKEDEAEVVRYIHDLFPTILYRQIAVQLNENAKQGEMMYFPIKYKALRAKYGGTHREWRDADIRYIICNDLYVGRLQYAVNCKSPYLRDVEPIYTYRPDLRILSDEIFERNQQVAALRRRIPSRSKGSPHLFSGIMRCPNCNSVMSGKRQMRLLKSRNEVRFSYTCSRYNRSGPIACPGYWINEREIINAVMPTLTELIQKSLRDHLRSTSINSNFENERLGEIRAELAKIEEYRKNLLHAVKHGAMSIEEIREENAKLRESKRDLESHLGNIKNLSHINAEITSILAAFDNRLLDVLTDLTKNRLRFNTFVRLFFSELAVEIDRPGMGWRKGKKKGEIPLCNARVSNFTLSPVLSDYAKETGLKLPETLQKVPNYENLSESHGSPRM